MKKHLVLIIVLLSFYSAKAQVPIDTALEFSVKDIYGNKIELFELLDQDKLVVIDFFSTSCGPCGLYAPDFQESYEDFGENTGNVFFLSICWGDDNNGVAYFDSVYGITHPSVSGSQGGGNQVHNNYQVVSTPTVILINPEREIIEQHIWEPTTENINAAIIAAGGSMVGTDELVRSQISDLSVFPNPAKAAVKLSFETAAGTDYHIRVYDLNGRMILKTESRHFPPGSNTMQLKTDHLKSGTYIVSLVHNSTPVQQTRLIIQE